MTTTISNPLSNPPDPAGRATAAGGGMTTIQDQIIYWMATGQAGASSLTMALWLGFGKRYRHCSYPHDPDDLRRCVEFLEAAPLCRPLLLRMGSLSPQWAQIVAAWDELEALLRQEIGNQTGKAPQTYALMLKLRVEAA